MSRHGQETRILSLANRFGPDPPFPSRVVTDCKANVKLCILLPSCSPHCPHTREKIIGLNFIILAPNCMHTRVMIHVVLAVLFVLAAPVWPNVLHMDGRTCLQACASIKPTQLCHHLPHALFNGRALGFSPTRGKRQCWRGLQGHVGPCP